MSHSFTKADKIVGKKEKRNVGVKGVHTFSICDVRSERAQFLERAIEEASQKRQDILRQNRFDVGHALIDNATPQEILAINTATDEALRKQWGEYNYRLGFLHKRFLKKQRVVENITTTVGRTVLAMRLSGTTTYTGIVNYGSLGTSATAVAVGQTQLIAETFRKALSSGTYVANVAYLEEFYSSTDTNGSFNEYAFWIDASGTANSGQMWNRFLSAITKSATESLNQQSTITFSDI